MTSSESARAFLKSKLNHFKGERTLRTVATRAGLSHTLLSLILKGQRKLSVETAYKLSSALELSEDEQTTLTCLAELEGTRSEKRRVEILKKLKTSKPHLESYAVDLEQYEAIANWYHWPIVELSSLLNGELTIGKIAKALRITLLESKLALERLQTLGILNRIGDGRFSRTRNKFHTSSENSHQGIRSYHRQMLTKALDAIEGQKIDQRYLSGLTLSIDREQLPEVARRIESFKEELMEFAANHRKKNAVYQIGIQVFDLAPHFNGEEL